MTPRARMVLVCLSIAAGCLLPAGRAFAADVVVVRSKASAKAAKLYNQAIDAFREAYDRPVEVIAQEGELVEADRLVEAIRASNARVVIAVGPKAAKLLHQQIRDLPLVYCMVSHAIQLGLRSDNATGVTMQPTPTQQLEAFRRVIPGLKRVGVIYHPKLSGSFVSAAKIGAAELGIQIVDRSITTNREVPAALKEVVEASDGLWLLRDGKVVTQEFFTQTLLLQAERKLPLMVFSERFVEKGALCSYSATYQDQGRQAARIARSILSGTPAREIPIQAPDGILTINLASAAKLGIRISPELLKRSDVRTVGQ